MTSWCSCTLWCPKSPSISSPSTWAKVKAALSGTKIRKLHEYYKCSFEHTCSRPVHSWCIRVDGTVQYVGREAAHILHWQYESILYSRSSPVCVYVLSVFRQFAWLPQRWRRTRPQTAKSSGHGCSGLLPKTILVLICCQTASVPLNSSSCSQFNTMPVFTASHRPKVCTGADLILEHSIAVDYHFL